MTVVRYTFDVCLRDNIDKDTYSMGSLIEKSILDTNGVCGCEIAHKADAEGYSSVDVNKAIKWQRANRGNPRGVDEPATHPLPRGGGRSEERRNKVSNLIQWPKAKYWTTQWNPVIGCKPCSPACEHCYAAAWAKRFGQSFKPHHSSHQAPPRKGIVFCGNMTDLFGDWMWPWFGSHDGYIVRSPEDIIGYACGKTHNEAIYLWLTKRVGSMVDAVVRAFDGHEWRKTRRYCHYFGFTAENQEWYDRRFAEFKRLPTNYKGWLSAEPLLEPIDLDLDKVYPPEAAPFQWLVVGCESGPNRRPCKIEWVESIVEQCRAANVPVFVKQLDIGGKCVTDINKFPEHLRIRQVPWVN